MKRQKNGTLAPAFKGIVSRSGCFFKVNILISTFSTFYGLSKDFHYPVQLFTLLLWNYLLILKMLTETLFRIPFSVISWFYLAPSRQPLLGCRENAQELFCHMRLPVWCYTQNHRQLPVSIFMNKVLPLHLLGIGKASQIWLPIEGVICRCCI